MYIYRSGRRVCLFGSVGFWTLILMEKKKGVRSGLGIDDVQKEVLCRDETGRSRER